MTKWVYTFGDGSAEEGAAAIATCWAARAPILPEMCNLGLPVPPGFTITTAGLQLVLRQQPRLSGQR